MSLSSLAYKDVVFFITGAAQGLGKATAMRFASQGAKICLFDISEIGVHAVANEIGLSSTLPCVGDVCSEDDMKQAIARTVKHYGKINVTVNCAGIAPPMKVLTKKGPHNLDQFIKVLHVNTVGTFNTIRLTAEIMKNNTPTSNIYHHGTNYNDSNHHHHDNNNYRGVIINTSSIASIDGQIGQCAYAASKGAISSMTLPIAREFANYGIRICTIAPGLFLTPLLENLPESVRHDLASTVPFPKRLGYPSEYAQLVQAIVENNMLNGEIIRLDGALRMQP